MADYAFDTNKFNIVVRELFIHHANILTGFDPNEGENLSEQGMSQIAVDVRQLCQKAYRAEVQKQKPKQKKKVVAPLSHYALVIYERYVVQQMELARAMRLTSGKHSEYARQLFEKLG